MKPYFIGDDDLDGFGHEPAGIGGSLSETMIIVISKSGGTAETGTAFSRQYKQATIQHGWTLFLRHSVVVAEVGRKLDKLAIIGTWIAFFPSGTGLVG